MAHQSKHRNRNSMHRNNRNRKYNDQQPPYSHHEYNYAQNQDWNQEYNIYNNNSNQAQHSTYSYDEFVNNQQPIFHNNSNKNYKSFTANDDDSKSIPNLLDIDGSMLEGGGQILRNSIAFAALMKKSVRITKIRANRKPKDGLKMQHSKGIGLVALINGGHMEGNYVGSKTVTYIPKQRVIYLNNYTIDIETAGSVGLLIQSCLPLLIFSPICCRLHVIGGTNASFAPQIDYFILVLQPMLKRLMNIEMNIKCKKRGFFPRGGGKVTLETTPINGGCIRAFDLTKRGKMFKIFGVVVVAGKNLSISVGNEVVNGAERELKYAFGHSIPIQIKIEQKCKIDSDSDGIGITVVAETDTGCLFGGSGLNQRRVSGHGDYAEIGRMAARELVQDWHSSKNGCTDRYLQDQLIIFMALAKGKSKMATSSLEMHTETAIHIAELLTGAKFNVKKQNDGTILVECEGIGHTEVNETKSENVPCQEMAKKKKPREKTEYLEDRPAFF